MAMRARYRLSWGASTRKVLSNIYHEGDLKALYDKKKTINSIYMYILTKTCLCNHLVTDRTSTTYKQVKHFLVKPFS